MTRSSTILLSCFLALAALAVAAGIEFGLFLLRPVAPESPRSVSVAEGAPFAKVARTLKKEGVVDSAFDLKLLAYFRGDSKKVKAGEYDFGGPAIPGKVLDRLVAGDVRRYKFTVPEGLTLREIAARLGSEQLVDARGFLQLSRDPQFIRSLGLDVPSLEGYLFPETYMLVKGMPPERLVRSMVEQFQQHLTPDLLAEAEKVGLDRHQLVTLASIIQKETANPEEMPLISAVYHNRLKKGMLLQADPTVIYGLENFDGNLTRRDLVAPTPYNTYRRTGLPPGPIANPGFGALESAANPAPVDYLYFVAKGDGSHAFSRTLGEHNKAVRHYQLHR